MELKQYPPAPEWGPDIMASIRFGNACREIDRENSEVIRAELERAHQSEKEGWRYAKELEVEIEKLRAALSEYVAEKWQPVASYSDGFWYMEGSPWAYAEDALGVVTPNAGFGVSADPEKGSRNE